MAALTALTIGAAVAGAAMSAHGGLRRGRAERDAAYSQAERDEKNAAYADLQATDSLARGRDDEGYLRQNVRQVIGAQRAGFAGQGVVVDHGSAADVGADTQREGDLDALRVRSNARREAMGFQVQAEDLRDQARINRRSGDAAMSAAKWGAVGTIVGTGASLMQQRWGWSGKGGGSIGGGGRLPSSRGMMSFTGPAAITGGLG